MNRTLMLIIADFLLLSMLAMAEFGESPAGERRSAARAPNGAAQASPKDAESGDEAAMSEARELVEVLELSLQEQLESRSKLNENLSESRAALEKTSRALAERQNALAQARQRLAEQQDANRELANRSSELQREKERLRQAKQSLEAKRREIRQAYASTKEKLSSAQAEKSRIAENLSDLKDRATLAQERLRSAERELREKEQALEQAQRERRELAAEKERVGRQLEAARAERELLAENLDRERQEKKVIREEKEKAFERTEKLSENVGALAQSSEKMRREIEASTPKTMSAIFSSFEANRAELRFDATFSGLFGSRDRSYAPRSILVQDGERYGAIAHADATPFGLGRDPESIKAVRARVKLGEVTHELSEVRFLRADPRLLFIPVPKRLAERSELKAFPLASDPERWEEAVLVDNDARNFGRAGFRRLAETGRFLKMDRPLFGEMVADFAPSKGDLVFSNNGEFIGLMVDGNNAVVTRSLDAGGAISVGPAYAPEEAGRVAERLRENLLGLPEEVR